MSKLWNKIVIELLCLSPINCDGTIYFKREGRHKFSDGEAVVGGNLKLLKNSSDKIQLIKAIENYNWNNILGRDYYQLVNFPISCRYLLIDFILELGVDVLKIKIDGYGNSGFFLCLGNALYFDTSDYDLLYKRLNYFKTVAHNFGKINFFKFSVIEKFCFSDNKKYKRINNFLQYMIQKDRKIDNLPLTFQERETYSKYVTQQKQRQEKISQLLNLKCIKNITNLVMSYVLN